MPTNSRSSFSIPSRASMALVLRKTRCLNCAQLSTLSADAAAAPRLRNKPERTQDPGTSRRGRSWAAHGGCLGQCFEVPAKCPRRLSAKRSILTSNGTVTGLFRGVLMRIYRFVHRSQAFLALAAALALAPASMLAQSSTQQTAPDPQASPSAPASQAPAVGQSPGSVPLPPPDAKPSATPANPDQ